MTDGDLGMKKPSTLLRSVCLLLRFHIEQGETAERPILPLLFSEERFPLCLPTDPVPPKLAVPSLEDIIYFANLIVSTIDLHPCTYLMSLTYIERMISNNKLTLHRTNWRRVLLSCLLLAGKVFHDEAPWNADVSDSFSWIKLEDVNKAELKLLEYLDFSVSFTPQQYAQTYMRCREISQREFDQLPSELLTADQLAALEQHTTERQRILREEKFISQSSDRHITKHTGMAVLS